MAEKYYLDKVGLQDVASHVNTRLKTVTTIPVSADDGAVRLYVGETGATYKKGHIYQYNATDLEWVDITGSTEYTAGNGIDIDNGEISVETYIFTGTQAQWDALTTEQKQEYDICNITDDGSADEAIYTKAEVDVLVDDKVDWENYAKTGVHNLIPMTLNYLKTINSNGSWSNNIYTYRGVTYEIQTDSYGYVTSIKVNGTASSAGNSYLFCLNRNSSPAFTLPTGKYAVNGCPSDGSSTTYFVQFQATRDGSLIEYGRDIGNGTDGDVLSTDALQVTIVVCQNKTVPTDTMFYPMLRYASDINSEFSVFAMTNRELTVNKAGISQISNPNLIDNPWFTINQRGESSYTSDWVYTVDRWLKGESYTLSVGNNGISASAISIDHGHLSQRLDIYNNLVGKTCTLSILKSTGEISSATGVVLSGVGTSMAISDNDIWCALVKDANFDFIALNFKNTTTTVRAVKLEIGSVSTLAMDTTPNYATELLKCQRYFYRLAPLASDKYGIIAMGIFLNQTTIRASIPLFVPMRTKPTLAFNLDTNKIKFGIGNSSDLLPITNIIIDNALPNPNLNFICASQSTFSAGQAVHIWFADTTSAYIDLSADL